MGNVCIYSHSKLLCPVFVGGFLATQEAAYSLLFKLFSFQNVAGNCGPIAAVLQ